MVDARHTAFVAFTIVAGIYALATVFYFPLVFLNLTWTHDGLPLANVLYYNAAGSNAQVARYAAQWWWVATDALRILVPGVAIGFVWYYSVYKTGTDLLEEAGVSTGLYIFVFTLITVVDLAKAGYYSYFWAFDCDGWQICRNDDPAGNANDANFSYVYMTSFTIGFAGLSLVLLLLEVAGKLITRASARANIMSSSGAERRRRRNHGKDASRQFVLYDLDEPDERTGEFSGREYHDPKRKKQNPSQDKGRPEESERAGRRGTVLAAASVLIECLWVFKRR